MQAGYVYKNGKYWTLRYYEDVLVSGQLVRKQKARKLAPVGDQYPTKTSVKELAESFLAPINSHQRRPESSQRVVDFLEHTYLPWVRLNKRPSTAKGYTDMFKLVRDHLGDVTMHEFHTPEAQRLMNAACPIEGMAHTTHKNVKSFLSGAFRFAKQEGAIDRENPMRDVSIPRGLRAEDDHAYTLDEVTRMLAVLEEPARTIVLVAALSGLAKAELKGLRWEDFDGEALDVSRNVWSGIVGETKTLARRAPVPVLAVVKDALEEHREREGRSEGFIFQARNGKPLRLENVARRDIRPALDKAGIAWHGWHAYRRGVATNLYELGAPPKTVQAILRHANVSTTLAHYIKPRDEQSRKAMDKLGAAFKKAARKLA